MKNIACIKVAMWAHFVIEMNAGFLRVIKVQVKLFKQDRFSDDAGIQFRWPV